MNRSLALVLFLMPILAGWSQAAFKDAETGRYDTYLNLADQVKAYRKDRLLPLDEFNQYAAETNTVILDTRSDSMYNAKHVKGAIHLNFSDFTAENLAALIPDRTTRILIYCNNNFVQDNLTMLQDIYFPSKSSFPLPISSHIEIAPREELQNTERFRKGYSAPVEEEMTEPVTDELVKEYTLALNIPTFISLYGFGYRNVYELRDLVNTTDPRIVFEGTAVTPSDVMRIPSLATTSELVNFEDYSQLMAEVKSHRAERLVSLDRFNELAKQPNSIILDFRSLAQYEAQHVKGALHLDFTEFTQETLNRLIPDNTTTILVYGNVIRESNTPEIPVEEMANQSSLSLNIPAYINLYGYGFKNVYELSESVSASDSRIQLAGTSVK